jgi:predicted transcriptional regulator
MATRMTIEVDDEVAERLRARVPDRELSHFINEAIAEKLAAIERAERSDQKRDQDAVDVTGYPEHAAEHIRELGRFHGE